MEVEAIQNQVVDNLSTQEEDVELTIPVGVSARHVHLSADDLETLFGTDYQLTVQKPLSQPGQFAATETVVVVGPRGAIEKVRILGPIRKNTQIEVAFTDAIRLGIIPPVRESGDIRGSAPATIVGPIGSVHIREGMIMAKRHVHMEPEDASRFRVKNGDYVQLKTSGERSVVFDNVLIRVSKDYKLEFHVDTDEANASLLRTGDSVRLVRLSSVASN